MRRLECARLETPGTERMALAPNRGSIIVMDHHPLYRSAVRQVITTNFKGFEVCEAGSFSELSELLEGDNSVEYIVYDLATDRGSSFAVLLYLRKQYPSISLIVMSANDKPQIAQRCLVFGVSAFLPKSLSAKALTSAMRIVFSGDTWLPPAHDPAEHGDNNNKLIERLVRLTVQDIRVLIHLCEGLFNRQIADKLGLAEGTIKSHVSSILNKLKVRNRTQAVAVMIRGEAAMATRTEDT